MKKLIPFLAMIPFFANADICLYSPRGLAFVKQENCIIKVTTWGRGAGAIVTTKGKIFELDIIADNVNGEWEYTYKLDHEIATGSNLDANHTPVTQGYWKYICWTRKSNDESICILPQE